MASTAQFIVGAAWTRIDGGAGECIVQTISGSIAVYIGDDEPAAQDAGLHVQGSTALPLFTLGAGEQIWAKALITSATVVVAAIGTLAVPVNLDLPTISGTEQVGETLTATLGTWDGDPSAFGIVWRRDGTAIEGATGETYDLVADDEDAEITVEVVAANAAGLSAPATSEPTGPIAPE